MQEIGICVGGRRPQMTPTAATREFGHVREVKVQGGLVMRSAVVHKSHSLSRPSRTQDEQTRPAESTNTKHAMNMG